MKRKNKGIAVVTGSSSRIGQTIAVALAHAGFHVIVHARVDKTRLEKTQQLVQQAGGECWPVVADFAHPEGVSRFCQQLEGLCDSLEILVHNAGVFPRCGFGATSEALLKATTAVHLHAPHALTGRLLPLLRQGVAPCVIHVTDSFVGHPYPNRAAYFMSKSALQGLTSALAVELAPQIRVNAVAPGIIASEQEKEMPFMKRLQQRIPLRRLGNMHDIAHAVVFLATEAPFITGHVLAVDGGCAA